MNQDLDHLRLLSIFHYIVSGLTALLACIPFIHFFLGLAMTLGWFNGEKPPPAVIGIFLMVLAALLILAGWSLAALIFTAGRFLSQRKRYTFCLVMAAIECLIMPFGTVLGVFTIIVLMRESVKSIFGVRNEPGVQG
jgi:hypothetical protein